MYVSPPCPCTGKAESPLATSVGNQGGDFQPIRCEIHELVDLIPLTSPGKVFALATLSWLSLIKRPSLW